MDGSAGMFGMNGEKRDGKHSGDNGIFGSLSLLLWDGNITMDQLNEMTISQIRELKQSKMQEMDGMTLNQIDELREKKKQEMNNMTMDDLSAKKESIRQISRIFNALDTETETVSAQA
jgi:TolA-binding protein